MGFLGDIVGRLYAFCLARVQPPVAATIMEMLARQITKDNEETTRWIAKTAERASIQ